MSTIAIDINDASLIVADESGVLTAEPGYALLAGGEVLTGNDAYAQASPEPRCCRQLTRKRPKPGILYATSVSPE